jgi:hypothetical protein
VSDDILARLLGCEWGRRLHTVDMPQPCDAPAVQIVRLHDTAHISGMPWDTIDVKLCQVHLDRLALETTPHVGPQQ